jgi:hypothetical protein
MSLTGLDDDRAHAYDESTYNYTKKDERYWIGRPEHLKRIIFGFRCVMLTNTTAVPFIF